MPRVPLPASLTVVLPLLLTTATLTAAASPEWRLHAPVPVFQDQVRSQRPPQAQPHVVAIKTPAVPATDGLAAARAAAAADAATTGAVDADSLDAGAPPPPLEPYATGTAEVADRAIAAHEVVAGSVVDGILRPQHLGTWLAQALNPGGEELSGAELDAIGALTAEFVRRNGFAHPSATDAPVGLNFLKGWATVAFVQDAAPALRRLRAARLAAESTT